MYPSSENIEDSSAHSKNHLLGRAPPKATIALLPSVWVHSCGFLSFLAVPDFTIYPFCHYMF